MDVEDEEEEISEDDDKMSYISNVSELSATS